MGKGKPEIGQPEWPKYQSKNLNQIAEDDNPKERTYLIHGKYLNYRIRYAYFLKGIFNCVNE